MAEIRWTEEAVTWLQDIYDFIAQDSKSAASKVVDGIYNKAQVLKDYPLIGHKYKDSGDGEIRILLFGHFRITYLIKNQENIDILGIFHGALDIDKYL